MEHNIVSLDVEGVLFKTRISTLTSVEGSYFDRLFEKDWRKLLNKDGRLFIDRDASVFPILLNFMRDGTKIPLPNDEYFLSRIRHEAIHFGLFDLVHSVDSKLGAPPKPSRPPPKTREKTVTFEARPILTPIVERRHSTELPIPTKKGNEKRLQTTKKKEGGKGIECISLPKNFAHVAHVGWNGNGVIFEKHLLGDEGTVRAIIDAAGRHDITPIYNMVNGNSEEYGSHSVEVILAGPHLKASDRSKENHGSDGRQSASSASSPDMSRERTITYSRPQKKPPKPPAKPPLKLQSTF